MLIKKQLQSPPKQVCDMGWKQCDQIKISKCLKVAKNDFARKMNDLDTFRKIALQCGQFG